MPLPTYQKEKRYSLSLKNEYYACMANELILARQRTMSVWANRIINFLVMQLVAEDQDLKTYTVKITDIAGFVGIVTGNVYDDIKNACNEIMQTVVEIGTGDSKNPWLLIHWMSMASYDGAGNLTLALSDEIKPYLIDLKDRGFFTQYQIKEILPMSSFYAIRLYQYITMEMNKSRLRIAYVEMTIEFAREFFECNNKFKQIVQFKKGVIETAVRQINENKFSKYYIGVTEYVKTGRAVTNVRFYLHDGNFMRMHNAHMMKISG